MEATHRRLLTTIAANAIVAYVLLFALVDRAEHLHVNLRQAWAAAMVAAATGLVTLLAMRRPGHLRRDLAVGAVLVAVLVGAFLGGRQHAGVRNAEFLRSMIPHQSEAIRLCRSSGITAPDLRAWCDEMIRQREGEIWQLQRILRRY